MIRNPMFKIALAALAAAIVILIIYSASNQSSVHCEVCIAYEGASRCRTASGATREEAIHTATTNACTFLSSGMSDSIRCSNTPPSSVTCEP
jgi:hypothetical protein